MVMFMSVTWSVTRLSGPSLHVSYRRSGRIFADDLPAEIHKRFVHICSSPRAGFVIMYVAPALADCKRSRPGNHPIFFQVRFVAHNDQWYLRVILDADDLVSKFVEFGERAEGGDGEDEEEALAGFHVEFTHRS